MRKQRSLIFQVRHIGNVIRRVLLPFPINEFNFKKKKDVHLEEKIKMTQSL